MPFPKILSAIVWLVFWYVILFLWVFVWGWSRNSCFLLMTFETIILALVLFFSLFYQVWFWESLTNSNSCLLHFLLKIFYSLLIGIFSYYGSLFILMIWFFFLASSGWITFEWVESCLLWCVNFSSSYSFDFLEKSSSESIFKQMQLVMIPLWIYLVSIITNIVYPLFRERKVNSFTFSLLKKIAGNWFQLFVIFFIWIFLTRIIWNISFLIVKLGIDIFLLWYHYLYLKK